MASNVQRRGLVFIVCTLAIPKTRGMPNSQLSCQLVIGWVSQERWQGMYVLIQKNSNQEHQHTKTTSQFPSFSFAAERVQHRLIRIDIVSVSECKNSQSAMQKKLPTNIARKDDMPGGASVPIEKVTIAVKAAN
eukprot:2811392-Ditylum_brightwellii.AAC.1